MAQNQQTITCPDGVWTQLTNADATSITFQVLSGEVYVRYTTDTTTPTEAHGVLYQRGEGVTKTTIANLTHLASADRAWAKPTGVGADQAAVYVDHG